MITPTEKVYERRRYPRTGKTFSGTQIGDNAVSAVTKSYEVQDATYNKNGKQTEIKIGSIVDIVV